MNRSGVLACMTALAFGPCGAFAQTPLLQAAEGSVCDFIAAGAGKWLTLPKDRVYGEQSVDFTDFLVKDAIADVDGDGDNEVLATFNLNGDSPSVVGLRPDYIFAGDQPDAADPNDLFRWTESGRWLPFGGEWHHIEFSDRELKLAVYVVTYGKKSVNFSCSFTPSFVETLSWPPQDSVAGVYDAIRKNRMPEGGPLTANDRRYLMTLESGFKDSEDSLFGVSDSGSITREVSIDKANSVVTADFDRDGASERVALLELQSGAGGGCGASWFELLPEAGEAAPNTEKRTKFLELQGVAYTRSMRFPANCGSFRRMIAIDDKGYLYSEEYSSRLNARKLEELRGGRLYPVAQSDFKAEHVIIYDRSKGGLVHKGDHQ